MLNIIALGLSLAFAHDAILSSDRVPKVLARANVTEVVLEPETEQAVRQYLRHLYAELRVGRALPPVLPKIVFFYDADVTKDGLVDFPGSDLCFWNIKSFTASSKPERQRASLGRALGLGEVAPLTFPPDVRPVSLNTKVWAKLTGASAAAGKAKAAPQCEGQFADPDDGSLAEAAE